ncbi:MAG: hypothetical protein JST00_37875 [Deltaproteobacteria bacterium]|nr:hypothetical protein [Deltaproteobacteria bacterium]
MTGEHLSPDIQELVRLFARHRVRYLLVGGEAVIHHGYARLTGDVDFFYDRSRSNCRRLYEALREFWGGEVPAVASPDDLLADDVVVQFGRPPNRIDLIASLGRLRFSSAWQRREKERLELRSQTVTLPIISLRDLLRAKREAGRPKDLDDIEHLVAVEALRRRRRRR